ncbi:MAG: M23 family metallopeptidase [Acidobacteria bacterium]|nr:M23 family metallopeptidase [Acidobacteriota bacterium]
MTRLAAILPLLAAIRGQDVHVAPTVVPQGGVMRIEGKAASARMDGRSIRIFPQAAGEPLGLMPVGAIANPGPYQLEVLDNAGKTLRTIPITVRDARFPKQNIALSPQIEQLRPAPGDDEAAAAFRRIVTDPRHWQEPFERPVPGCMSSPYGVARLHNGKLTGAYHGGLDQHAPAGQPIRAIAAGTVRLVRPFQLMGNTVGVDHGQGVESMYLHLSKFAVADGASVNKGDVVGYVGATGRATGPHLHWSIYVNGIAVNPSGWVTVKPCAAAPPRAKKRSAKK